MQLLGNILLLAGLDVQLALKNVRRTKGANSQILVMVVLGGMGSMLGSILSATVLTILPELLRSFSDYRMVVYSLALVVMMIFRPKGLLGSYDFSLSRSLETFLNRLLGRTENPKKEAADNE